MLVLLLLAPILLGQDLVSTGELNIVGDASRNNGRLRLAPSRQQQVGAVWMPVKQPVAGGFETEFRFQLTELGERGADGFAFVLQNHGPDALGGRGNSGGFAMGDGWGDPKKPGIPLSLAVFFDTHQNLPEDPSDNLVAICMNGQASQMRWPPPRLASNHKLKTKFKDRKVHWVRIQYRPPMLSVFIDDPKKAVLATPVDLAPVVDSSGRAYVGFTGSTGSGHENHDILEWSFGSTDVSSNMSVISSSISFVASACLPDRNLCTPEKAVVDERGPGEYHIVLPAHLEWGASIPNQSGRHVEVINVRGSVCWDLKESGAQGCGGPAALINKTSGGRTMFSISDPTGSFADNQGFLEFDVRIR